ncbi:unnamed protein product [Pseudo-nitzschia multistriata]|uniref:EF-hand domain-containing protein n=1 Tax=Pseudo-nitzschia multistriata TaxID=183589 RepID=A0A448ZJQ5_9STRA|nr:unnamed protein product [Pseudo-nitzschia multistriata]
MSEIKKAKVVEKPTNIESTASPGGDAELGKARPPMDRKASVKHAYLTKLFGSDYNLQEVYYVLAAACVIALNQGFVNGVCMSGLLVTVPPDGRNPERQMIAGFAGAYTNLAHAMLAGDGHKYTYNLCMIASYMGGSFIAAMINPHAKPYVIEPRYGPTFIIGGCFLLAASLLAGFEAPSRFVFFLATASGGVANGIASIYSANLIRCTLTGATTDVAIVLAQMIHRNNKGVAKGSVLSLIIFFFWVGGIISFWAVRALTENTLFINAALFFSIGLILIVYLVKELGVSVYDAIFGTWKWKNVLQKLHTEDGELTPDKMMAIFDRIDQGGDGNGEIDGDELRDGLRLAKVKMTDYEIKTLFRAADDDGDGVIDRQEWADLIKKIL